MQLMLKMIRCSINQDFKTTLIALLNCFKRTYLHQDQGCSEARAAGPGAQQGHGHGCEEHLDVQTDVRGVFHDPSSDIIKES